MSPGTWLPRVAERLLMLLGAPLDLALCIAAWSFWPLLVTLIVVVVVSVVRLLWTVLLG